MCYSLLVVVCYLSIVVGCCLVRVAVLVFVVRFGLSRSVNWLLHVICYVISAVRGWLRVVCCSLCVVPCALLVVACSCLFDGCCSLSMVRCLLLVV